MIAALYVSSADLLSVHCARILNGGRLHGGPQKTKKNKKIEGVGTCPGQCWTCTYTYQCATWEA